MVWPGHCPLRIRFCAVTPEHSDQSPARMMMCSFCLRRHVIQDDPLLTTDLSQGTRFPFLSNNLGGDTLWWSDFLNTVHRRFGICSWSLPS